jgi:hypothetical protein
MWIRRKEVVRKGYIGKFTRHPEPEDHLVDYDFCETAASAVYWPVRELAESNCALANRGVKIPASNGLPYVIRNFEVEELAPGKFVIFCNAPFEMTGMKGEQ